MTASEPQSLYSWTPATADDAEAELQQELRAMFDVDTQQYLQDYFSLVQGLNDRSWAADIQHIYRAVHTIKGGAVTVEADAMLHAGMVLEDLLSDLRYLDRAPDLSDGQLCKMLLEAGELLSSSIEIKGTGAAAIAQVQPTVRRIHTLHELIRQRYLPDWNELKQVHQEFAEQGFDLVVLELEMALNQLPPQGMVPPDILQIAQQTLMQLAQIGGDLQFAESWTPLMAQCQTLVDRADSSQWKRCWLEYFQILKECAKQGGELSPALQARLAAIDAPSDSVALDAVPVGLEPAGVAAPDLDTSVAGHFAEQEWLSEFNLDEFSDLATFGAEPLLSELQETAASDEMTADLPEWLSESGLGNLALDALASETVVQERLALDAVTFHQAAAMAQPDAVGADLSELEQIELFLDSAGISDLFLDGFEGADIAAIAADPASAADPESANFGDRSDLNTLDDLTAALNGLGDADATAISDLSDLPDLSVLDRGSVAPAGLEEVDTAFGDRLDLSVLDDVSVAFDGFEDASAADPESAAYSESDDFSDLSALNTLDDAELFSLSAEDWAEPSEGFVPASAFEELGLFPQANAQPQPSAAVNAEIASPEPVAETKRGVQISVPLERLDQSAQQVVETLLTARGVMNSSQKLQTQLAQITALTQESAQFITRLRQLQDDYALMRTLSDDRNDSNNVNLERYRQGYTTINRLLENILRMSELGQEIETVTQQTSTRLDKLDRSILRLKDGIETSRLVPFRNLSLRARAIVRDLSNRYGKPVELSVQGEQVELDASILQQLEPALLHLLRNAYDHGLETVETRLAHGKPAQGTIQLSLHRRGNLYRLVLQDDGGGIDAQAIARKAQEKGFALNQTRTSAELLAVLCQPGFSSRSAVTEVSGRGVGMDVVASQIAAMNGKFSLETRPGQGTAFIIEVPAPQLLVPCVLLEVGDRTVALPTDDILETVLLGPGDLSPLEAEHPLLTWSVETDRGTAPGFDLANYWLQPGQAPSQSSAKAWSDTAIAIRTRSAAGKGSGTDLWFIADDLLTQEELLINPLPTPLVAPVGLLGVSLQPDGRLISILDPIALATALQSAPAAKSVKASQAPSPVPVQSSSIKILVVDDAALMRRRMEGSLSTNGFTVSTCSDGLEAWNWLQTNERPDLMITDVEMPNMDGFTLIDRCRQAGLELPILVVSSRLSEEWGKEARRLGASDYLNKGFSTPELIAKVNQLLIVSVSAST
ncbi:response regulator [Altericista sp. CCNU0014]|uniref:response regulator n=1 Tax=Altericista sp. CCNU0014 TaxID=3082949 RepID=UPI003850CA49